MNNQVPHDELMESLLFILEVAPPCGSFTQ